MSRRRKPPRNRIDIVERFSGDIEATGVAVFVVPGSGTAELAGLCGEGGFRAELGHGGELTLDYHFE